MGLVGGWSNSVGLLGVWYGFGPMKLLTSDHEGALDSDEGRAWASRWGIDLQFRPRGSHATTVEKHNDLMRRSLHTVGEQCERDGLNVSDSMIVDECNFAHNALVDNLQKKQMLI